MDNGSRLENIRIYDKKWIRKGKDEKKNEQESNFDSWNFERRLEEGKGGMIARKYLEEMKEKWKRRKRRELGKGKRRIF